MMTHDLARVVKEVGLDVGTVGSPSKATVAGAALGVEVGAATVRGRAV